MKETGFHWLEQVKNIEENQKEKRLRTFILRYIIRNGRTENLPIKFKKVYRNQKDFTHV